MKLYLKGHDYKYAVEQMLLTMFPAERPEYAETETDGDCMTVSLEAAGDSTSAECVLRRGGEVFTANESRENAAMPTPLLRDRQCQRLIKNVIYRAALASGVRRPAWGALTGVRPGKLLGAMLREGLSEDEALERFMDEYNVTPERAALCLDTSRETMAAMAGLEERDICLYVGIPFCPTRCSYCSFVSQSVEKSMKLIEPFMDALLKEVRATAEQVKKLGLRVVSIYMGGGTPTTLSAEQLETLCTALENEFDLGAVREYTVEAGRPDTITVEKLQTLRRHGVDRVSVNPQTMSDSVLRLIGRRHTAADIEDAFKKVREVGGFTVNMDLIAGLPGDSAEGFRETLDRVLALNAENVTVHTLSLKKGSRITLEGAELPGADVVAEMLDIAGEKLRAQGYSPYYLYRQKFMSGGFENVGWAKDGYINLYNICIMEELCSILAIGGGGSTKLIRRDDGRNIRLMAPKYPLEYINNIEKTCADKVKIKDFYDSIKEEK